MWHDEFIFILIQELKEHNVTLWNFNFFYIFAICAVWLLPEWWVIVRADHAEREKQTSSHTSSGSESRYTSRISAEVLSVYTPSPRSVLFFIRETGNEISG